MISEKIILIILKSGCRSIQSKLVCSLWELFNDLFVGKVYVVSRYTDQLEDGGVIETEEGTKLRPTTIEKM